MLEQVVRNVICQFRHLDRQLQPSSEYGRHAWVQPSRVKAYFTETSLFTSRSRLLLARYIFISLDLESTGIFRILSMMS